jgi:hypothetical protein
VKHKILLFGALFVFIFLVGLFDRRCLKSNNGFSLHVIEAPFPALPDPNSSLPFPKELFDKPFHYLGKGAQSFVFESEDKQTVLKFYRFPSHLRRFPWVHHPLGYLFSTERKKIKEYNLKRLELSFHSFYLAAEPLIHETGVLYVHLQPTDNLQQKVHLIDRVGTHHNLPLDSLVFVVQKRGVSFLPLFKEELAKGNKERCKQMIDSLIDLIHRRCSHQITDLDNMEHDNYGWLDGKAIHLDIGRFHETDALNAEVEIARVAEPLTNFLAKASTELHDYFECSVKASSRIKTLD